MSRLIVVSSVLVVAAFAALGGCDNGGSSDADTGDVDATTDVQPDVDEDADSDPDADGDAEPDVDLDAEAEAEVPDGPGPEFDDLCGAADWEDVLTPAFVNDLGGTYGGYYNGMPVGTLDIMKVIPAHPFHVRTIRAAFAHGAGQARIRLMRSFGRSYPDVDGEAADLVAPIDLTVPRAAPETWLEIDVSGLNVFLLPTQHYTVVYEHLEEDVLLAVEDSLEGITSKSLIIVPGETTPYGVDGEFRMQLEGDYFCSWDGADLWFEEDLAQPFLTVNSQRAAITDLNGDGHDDLVVNEGGPRAFFGDGAGGFAEPGITPFPDAAGASMLVFADVDNDGDEDAFVAYYVSADGDGDDWTKEEGDCDDTTAAVMPSASEVDANGLDDNCDGVIDDGTSTADTDADTFTIADGDCDDNRTDVHPGAPELLDSRDNDCDREADEDFVHTIQLNDASVLRELPSSGVEYREPTAAAAFGDGDGDGNIDLYFGNWLEHYPDPGSVDDHYFEGAGDGTFTDVMSTAGTYIYPARACYGVLWADYNNDGWQDIWVGNYGYELNLLFRNNGNGTFMEVGLAAGVARDAVGSQGGNTFGGDWGDFDNDGDLDLYEANIAHPRYQPWSDPSFLAVNNGAPAWDFARERETLGLVYDEGDVNAAFADFDNDGDLDLAVASLYTGHFFRLYRNDGGRFSDVTYQTDTIVEDSVSPVWSDVDEDGDLDLVVADRTGPEYVHLFRNAVGQDNGWLELLLEGSDSNRDGIGARVTLTAGGATQIREVKGGGGHSNTQSTRVVHFGLGDETSIGSLTVRWVGGTTETITGLSPGHRYRVVEGSGTGVEIF